MKIEVIRVLGIYEKHNFLLTHYHFTLRDEFSGIELRNDGLQDFVGDGRQHAVVVVKAQSCENVGKGVRPKNNSYLYWRTMLYYNAV